MRAEVGALAQRRHEDERLGRRAELALGLDGEVELPPRVALRGDHRRDAPAGGLDGHQRGRRVVVAVEQVADRLAALLLELLLDGRVNLQPARLHTLLAVALDELTLDELEEVALVRSV